MRISHDTHQTYCSNINPGAGWHEVFKALKDHLPAVKKQVSPDRPMGIGLRLSNLASLELQEVGTTALKDWMSNNGFYVFTMNGFPYGGFHRQRVKDHVHQPDWTKSERLDYTIRLFDQLADLLPEGQEGGISTSPLSYKYWWTKDQQQQVFEQSTRHLLEVVRFLNVIYQEKGVLLHLDIEPEPDGLIENSRETIDYFNQWLLPMAAKLLPKDLQVSAEEVKEIVLRHVTVCYDVCHFAVAFESHQDVLDQFRKHGIRIGKIQISSALKSVLGERQQRTLLEEAYRSLDEPTYLHQVVAQSTTGDLHQYPDLPQALNHIHQPEMVEWRTHFHVPVFVESYGLLDSTRRDIEQVLCYWSESPMTQHLEVETYTWEVLPEELRSEIDNSIAREMTWVKQQLEK